MAATVTGYRNGGTAGDGTCDCVGLIMAALRKLEDRRFELHGSNYFARRQTEDLREISSADELRIGDVVFKARMPSDSRWDLPERYRAGGRYDNGDSLDYYHIGAVTGIAPLEITHCTDVAGGIARDNKQGGWRYAARVKGVTCMTEEKIQTAEPEDMEDTEEMEGPVIPRGMYTVVTPDIKPVRFRKLPSTLSDTLMKLPYGTRVRVIGDVAGCWARVEYAGLSGYIMLKFLCYAVDQQGAKEEAEPTPAQLFTLLTELRGLVAIIAERIQEDVDA